MDTPPPLTAEASVPSFVDEFSYLLRHLAVPCSVHSIPLSVTMDTGSCWNLIDMEELAKLDPVIELRPWSGKLVGANCRPLDVKRIVSFPLRFPTGAILYHRWLVVKRLPLPAIAGQEMMKGHEMVIRQKRSGEGAQLVIDKKCPVCDVLRPKWLQEHPRSYPVEKDSSERCFAMVEPGPVINVEPPPVLVRPDEDLRFHPPDRNLVAESVPPLPLLPAVDPTPASAESLTLGAGPESLPSIVVDDVRQVEKRDAASDAVISVESLSKIEAELAVDTIDIKPEQRTSLREIVRECVSAFAVSDADIGCAKTVKHKIQTGESPPIKQHARRVAVRFRDKLTDKVRELLDSGIIERSDSPWA